MHTGEFRCTDVFRKSLNFFTKITIRNCRCLLTKKFRCIAAVSIVGLFMILRSTAFFTLEISEENGAEYVGLTEHLSNQTRHNLNLVDLVGSCFIQVIVFPIVVKKLTREPLCGRQKIDDCFMGKCNRLADR